MLFHVEIYNTEWGSDFSCLYFLYYYNKWLKSSLLLSFQIVLIDHLTSGRRVLSSLAQLLKFVSKEDEKEMVLKSDKLKEWERDWMNEIHKNKSKVTKYSISGTQHYFF